jgi:hypothetical protein
MELRIAALMERSIAVMAGCASRHGLRLPNFFPLFNVVTALNEGL